MPGIVKKGAVPKEEAPVIPDANTEDLETTRKSGKTVRIIAGSYEHNLLGVALTVTSKTEVFTPIFHFTPHTQSIRCLGWHGRHLVSGSNDELIRIYDLKKRKEVGSLLHHTGQIVALTFFKKWLFSASSDGRILIWRSRDWELLGELKGHKSAVEDFAVHESGKIAISIGKDRRLFLWNLMTAKKASVQRLTENPRQVAWQPNSNNYVVGYDFSLTLHKSDKKTVSATFKSRLHKLRVLKFGDHTFIVTSHDNGTIVFRHANAIENIEFELQGHSTRVKDFDVLDSMMASVSSDGKIVVWDLVKRDQVAVYTSGDRLNCVLMVPDEIEDAVKKRPAAQLHQSDYESEPEELAVKPKQKKKRAKVIVVQG